jgi:hypothetical protein
LAEDRPHLQTARKLSIVALITIGDPLLWRMLGVHDFQIRHGHSGDLVLFDESNQADPLQEITALLVQISRNN